MKLSEDPDTNLLLCAMLISVVLNIVVPNIVNTMASDEQKQIHGGDGGLVDSMIRMCVHHTKTPVPSSIIVAVMVGLSVYLAQNYC